MSPLEFEAVMSKLNLDKYYRIYEPQPGLYSLMAKEDLYQVIDDLLVLINGKLGDT